MKNLKYIFISALSLSFLACQNAGNEGTTNTSESSGEVSYHEAGQAFVEDEVSDPNILQIAIGSADHSTLVAAVQATKLENALVNAGPLTVFAPTNAAFDALPEGTVENLLKPENLDQLAAILKHHVTPGNYDKEFLKNFKKLGQADDTDAMVEVKGEDVYIGGAKIVASVKGSNGIVHVVDAIILPTE
ncbi:MAG: fasciclin domain-containing protein [Vicingaceae bacterium]